MRRLTIVAVLALAAGSALATTCSAQQEVPLAFKFVAGDVNQYDLSISGAASLVAMGNQVTPVSVRGNVSLTQTVTQVFPDGSGRIETRIPSGEVTIVVDKDQAKFSYANGQMRWFANGKESSPPQGGLDKLPFLGTPVVYTMMPDGRAKDVALADPRLMEEAFKALPKLDFAAMQSMGEAVFPTTPVKIGETWRHSAQLAPFPGFPFLFTSSRTLDSYADAGGIGLAKIVGAADTRYVGSPTPPMLPGIPGMSDASVSISEIRQTVNSTEFFDTTNGRLMRGDYDVAFSASFAAKSQKEEKTAGITARLRVNVQSR
jgi:hypothetical protein